MKKAKKAVLSEKFKKNGSFNSVLLAWVLSLLAIPTIMSLVPAYFDNYGGGYGTNGETIWYYVWLDITRSLIIFLFFTLILSYAISLILKKDAMNNISLKKINKSAFTISTIINVTFCVGLLIYSYLLPLVGFRG